jgi:sugar lactone lactonase YvrE
MRRAVHRRSVFVGFVLFAATAVAGVLIGIGSASSGSSEQRGSDNQITRLGAQATWTTVFASTLAIEGLTGDDEGHLYVAQRGGAAGCPVQRITIADHAVAQVGLVPPPCAPSGLTFGADRRLYITGGGSSQDQIDVLTPDSGAPATVFATGVPGANGLAFDRFGNLWTGDGTTGQGRVWRIGPDGGAATEMFRVQPLANEVNAAGAANVGRDVRTLPPGTITVTSTSRNASNTAGSQPLVANGVAFTEAGDLLIADTARGAIWKVHVDSHGDVTSPVGCDATFATNTLCLDNVLVEHPYLEGADGFALDRAGNIWTAANERNAIVVAMHDGTVSEFFRNPPDATTNLRNNGPLETPTSPFISGQTLCVTQSDGNRRDNVPNSGGEVGPGHAAVAKVSCLDQRLDVPGLPLPVK